MINLTITKERFLEWYFEYGQDQENKDLRIELANSIIHQMRTAGFGSYSVNELFDGCNQEAIIGHFTEELNDADKYDTELSDLGFEYTISLIDNLNEPLKELCVK